MKQRAAIYARVSTGDQRLETQALDLREMAKQRDLVIVREYRDVISGAKSKRSGLDIAFFAPSVDDHGSPVIFRSVSVRPKHLFDQNFDQDYQARQFFIAFLAGRSSASRGAM